MRVDKFIASGFVFALLVSSILVSMPGTDTATTSSGKSALDQQISTDLATLSGYRTVSEKLSVLNSILNYVGKNSVSNDTQVEYYSAVQHFDKFARTCKLSKPEIAQLDKFFKTLQVSNLVYIGAVADIAAKIDYWAGLTKKAGLTPHQRALQRRQSR